MFCFCFDYKYYVLSEYDVLDENDDDDDDDDDEKKDNSQYNRYSTVVRMWEYHYHQPKIKKTYTFDVRVRLVLVRVLSDLY